MSLQKNLKLDFIKHINKVNSKVYCCEIKIFKHKDKVETSDFFLYSGYNDEEWKFFLDLLDINYTEYYYVLIGNIWFEDKSWSNYFELTESNNWINFKIPKIPEYLLRIDKERENKIDKLI